MVFLRIKASFKYNTCGEYTCRFVEHVLFRRQFDPVATDDFCVGHEPDLEIDVGLEGGVRNVAEVAEIDFPLLQQTFGRSDQFRDGQRDLDEGDHFVSLQKRLEVSKQRKYNTERVYENLEFKSKPKQPFF